MTSVIETDTNDPIGAHGCEDRLLSLVPVLSRHLAIYCQVSISLSPVKCYSSSIAKVPFPIREMGDNSIDGSRGVADPAFSFSF